VYRIIEKINKNQKKSKMRRIAKFLTVIFTGFSSLCLGLSIKDGNLLMVTMITIHYLVTMAGAKYAKSKGRCFWKGFAICWNYPVFGHIFIAILREKRVFSK